MNSTRLYTNIYIYITQRAIRREEGIPGIVYGSREYRAASSSKNGGGGGRRGVPIIPRAENRSSLNAERGRISNSEVPLTLNPEDLLSLVYFTIRAFLPHNEYSQKRDNRV